MKGKISLYKNGNLVMVKEFKDKKSRIEATNEIIKQYGKQFQFHQFEFRILHDY